jgi:hypothetical protein
MSGEVSYFSRFLVKFTPMPVVTASLKGIRKLNRKPQSAKVPLGWQKLGDIPASSFQYPVEIHRDLQRRWGRLFQRTVVPNEVRNKYRRVEEDHDRLGNATTRQARDPVPQRGK